MWGFLIINGLQSLVLLKGQSTSGELRRVVANFEANPLNFKKQVAFIHQSSKKKTFFAA